MIRRVLVANRGEIAVRIIRACREAGVESVAVFSDADASARHVALADSAVRIGPAPARDSYLNTGAIVDAARSAQADAVHPGYGFLSERAAFADACVSAGLTFIGPPADVIERMGSKIAARETMRTAGVPVVPGETPADQSDEGILTALRRVGVPVLIKASAGGGGKGMRTVREETQARDAIAAARRESENAFGDGTLYVERLIDKPRHVEVQICGDARGNVVHLLERECSLQRRHQKVIEESPSPALTPRVRARLCEAAVAAARAVRYQNAGTVEFLLEGEGDSAQFFFLEMNTRLQVEHPVTEAIVGIDIVRAQLAIAGGAALPWKQEAVTARGHAFECRVYAEDPSRGFLPQAGPLLLYREPSGPGVRVDSGVSEGDAIGVDYDPMIAKVTVHAETRESARTRALTALRSFPVLGVRTNIAFLIALLDHPAFVAGEIDTGFIDRHLLELTRMPPPAPEALAVAAVLEVPHAPEGVSGRRATPDPWTDLRGWGRMSAERGRRVTLVADDGSQHDVGRLAGGATIADQVVPVARLGGEQYRAGQRTLWAVNAGAERWVFLDGRTYVFRVERSGERPRTRAVDHSGHAAPMPATVTRLEVAPGDRVRAGDVIVTLEAMKMELPVRAAFDGIVKAVACRVGELVQPGEPLIEIEQTS